MWWVSGRDVRTGVNVRGYYCSPVSGWSKKTSLVESPFFGEHCLRCFSGGQDGGTLAVQPRVSKWVDEKGVRAQALRGRSDSGKKLEECRSPGRRIPRLANGSWNLPFFPSFP